MAGENPSSFEGQTTQEKQALSPEEYEKKKEQILMLSKIQRNSLSDEVISSYLEKYHNVDLSKYSPETRKKFIEEMKILFGELKNYDESMVNKLKGIRENMSFGLESGKDEEYYQKMIVGNKIDARVKIIQEALKNINGEKVTIGDKQFNKQDYNSLKDGIVKLDQTNNLDIFNNIGHDKKFERVFKEEILSKIQKPSNYLGIMMDFGSLLDTGIPSADPVHPENSLKHLVFKDGKTMSGEDLYKLYKQYESIYQTFETQNKIFQLGNVQNNESEPGQGFGFDKNKYGLGYEDLEKTYAEELVDIDKMGVADLVIMLRVLGSVIPVAGDLVGGYDDFHQANAGINFDGSVHGLGEKMFTYFTAVLGLSIVGGEFAKLAKGPKLAKVIIKLTKIIEQLKKSEKLSELAKNDKIMKMLESMEGLIPKIGELIEKIKLEDKSIITDVTKSVKESSFYNSHFSTKIPENLKSQNPIAWIDKLGEIHYNQTIIEEKFGVRITDKNGKTLFDGKSLKDHKKAQEILEYLKELKIHEVTHRILEVKGVQEIKIGDKIYSQEDLCNIVDGSKKLSIPELEALEKVLKNKLGEDFKLLENGELNTDFLRRYDTKMLVEGGNFSRNIEVAKSGNVFEKLEKNREISIPYNGNPITLYLGDNQVIQIIKSSDLPKDMQHYNTPYIIIQSDYLKQTNGNNGFKGLRNGETVSIGRSNERFSFSDEISKNHVTITLEGNNIKLIDNSTNGTFIHKDALIPIKTARKIDNTEEVIRISKKKNPTEVPRLTEVMAIGDLHGEIKALWANLDSLGVIDKSGKWIGGNKQIVFHGDILADRGTQGLEILEEIGKIQKQAREQGGDISILVGNHDYFAIAFLLDTKSYDGVDYKNYGEQALGMGEFKKYMNMQIDNKNLSYVDMYSLDRNLILQNMRKSQVGKETLENMYNMKIIDQIDDTLFTHTDITPEMADMIINKGIGRINQIYQQGLKNVLIENKPVNSLSQEFFEVTKTFLNTDNRSYMTDNQGMILQNMGINHILHGHSNHKDANAIGGILVQSVDFSAFKSGKKDNLRSIGIIRQDGNIQVGIDKESIIGLQNGDYTMNKIEENTEKVSKNENEETGIKGKISSIGDKLINKLFRKTSKSE